MPNVKDLSADQIKEILDLLNTHPGTAMQYIGARYVPIFADPPEWSNTKTYEPLTIVLNDGNSYTSRQFVPVGIDINNADYWANTGNYNSQVEQYRQEVMGFDSRITANTNNISENTNNISENTSDISELSTRLTAFENATNEKKTIMLAFGDSFGDESGEWADLVAMRMGKTLDNFCLGGATWPFTTKLNEAISKYSSSDEKETIAFAIAYGGINSTVYGTMDATNIKTFITNFNEAFPGIPLFIAPLNNCNPYNTSFPNAYRNTLLSAPGVYQELRTFNGQFILLENSYYFNTGSSSNWNNDLLHPSATGSATIANNMISAMLGNNTVYQELVPIGDWTTKNNVVIQEPGYITARGIMMPRLLVNSIADSNIYFASNGFRIGNSAPLTWYDLDNSSKALTYKDPNFNVVIRSDTAYQQIVVQISGISFSSGHSAVIPAQFIPFGIPVAAE